MIQRFRILLVEGQPGALGDAKVELERAGFDTTYDPRAGANAIVLGACAGPDAARDLCARVLPARRGHVPIVAMAENPHDPRWREDTFVVASTDARRIAGMVRTRLELSGRRVRRDSRPGS